MMMVGYGGSFGTSLIMVNMNDLCGIKKYPQRRQEPYR